MPKKAPAPSPHSYHHGHLHDALVRTARHILEKEGFAALSLRRVAHAAGVSPAAPYHHFADKQALLDAVAEEGFAALRSGMLARMAKKANPAARLDACGVGYVLFAVENPALFQLMFGRSDREEPANEALAAASELAQEVLQTAVAQCSPGDKVNPLTSLRLWALAHGVAKLILEAGVKPTDYGLKSTEKLVESLLDRGKWEKAG
jgi:AcrR family transcriptional regulator